MPVIYKNNYFSKEMQKSRIVSKKNIKMLFSMGVFLGLFSFALHFMLQSVYESVLTDTLPQIMHPSYFSVAYIFTSISFIYFIVYFLMNYKILTFFEITENKWYALIKMGYNPLIMIFSKISAVILMVTITYTVGFLISVFLTAFLKYTFVLSYLPPIFLAGYINVVVIVFITMSASLFINNQKTAKLYVIGSAFLMVIIKLNSHFYDIMSSSILMQNIKNLFNVRKSIYLIVLILIALSCILLCFFRAKQLSKYYMGKQNYPKNVICIDYKTKKEILQKNYNDDKLHRLMGAVSNVVLVTIVMICIVVDLFVLIISVSTPEKEIAIFGTIPYIFQSSTMQPAIIKNDLAYFHKINGSNYEFHEDDIILFKENEKVFVERIIKIEKNILIVDIDSYPPMAQKGVMVKFVNSNQVYGIYFNRNRWLGALILFCNTIFGRILLLVVPSALIFFYKPIINFFKRIGQRDYSN